MWLSVIKYTYWYTVCYFATSYLLSQSCEKWKSIEIAPVSPLRKWARRFPITFVGWNKGLPNRVILNLSQKKRSRPSFYIANDQFVVKGRYIRIPRLGWVKMAESLHFEGKIMGATVSLDGTD